MSSAHGYSPRILPFQIDPDTGFTQNMSLKQVAVQNFMNLLLCCPGERIMEPKFGVCMRKYLFEMNLPYVRNNLKSAIKAQAAEYLPYIKIQSVDFTGTDVDKNLLKINITFRILTTGEVAWIDLQATPDILEVSDSESELELEPTDEEVSDTADSDAPGPRYSEHPSSTGADEYDEEGEESESESEDSLQDFPTRWWV
tara:strand:+ start:367 stop:963 length:597 start_codon:yes stop_codon:yes gene_type:complete